MLLDIFLDMLLTLGIVLLAGFIAAAALTVILVIALFIKGLVDIAKDTEDDQND